MNELKLISYLLLISSIVMILYALIFSPADWIIYAVAIVFIPIFILSFGLITMAKARKDEEEERKEEPFIGY
jgi:energy-converting hydrogenase A subunit I